MKQKLIGKYFTFIFGGKKSDISGVVLAFNPDYTLIRQFKDYCPDGYTIFKNERVEYASGAHEKTATRILKLKKYSADKEPTIPIDSLDNIFKFISKKYKLIELGNKKGDACDVVKYLNQEGNVYLFKELTTNAKWRYTLRLPERSCRFISFDTNYLNALSLIAR